MNRVIIYELKKDKFILYNVLQSKLEEREPTVSKMTLCRRLKWAGFKVSGATKKLRSKDKVKPARLH